MDRREFIKGCAGMGAAMLATRLNALAFGADDPKSDGILIHIFLRGGCDALNLVAPMGDKFYQDARAEGLKLKESGQNKALELANKLNNQSFGMHPAAAGLAELYASGHLAVVHACGLSNGTRSHFEAQEIMDLGMNLRSASSNGWMSRYVQGLGGSNILVPAVHLGSGLPLRLQGSTDALALRNIKDFDLKGDVRLAGLLRQQYSNEKGLLGEVAQATLAGLSSIKSKLGDTRKSEYSPRSGVNYPQDNQLADSLKSLAQIIKLDLGLRAASVDFGGWDTHEGQSWHFPRLVEKLSGALSAFYNDMNGYHQKITIVVLSEFGRRLKSNQSDGTDHGHGGLALVLGGKVNGKKILGNWLGLETDLLDHRVDLQVTTDYRSILSEAAAPHLDKNSLSGLFPSYKSDKPVGILR